MQDQSSQPVDPLARIIQQIDDASADLRQISLHIHENPELRWKEKMAHQCLTDYISKQPGWIVTPSAYGLETAFVAVFQGAGTGPVVSFNAEYDALPDIGHACGHNLIAIATLGAALATAKVVQQDSIPGKVVLFGTPAEEGGGGKIKLINNGAYADHQADVSMICHPDITPDSVMTTTSAYRQFTVEYFGREAHAAAKPWEGINALDALISAINNVNAMRQQTEPGDLVQYRISNGGAKPNIIHAYAAGIFVLRAPTEQRLIRLHERFDACLNAGAIATGATLKVREGNNGYLNHVPNRSLGKAYQRHLQALGGKIIDVDQNNALPTTSASWDQGNVSRIMPSLAPTFWIRSENDSGEQTGGPHTPDFEKASKSIEAHQLALRAAKALAATAVDILTIPGLLEGVKAEWRHLKNTLDQ